MFRVLDRCLVAITLLLVLIMMNGCQPRSVGVSLAGFENALAETGQSVTIATTAVASPVGSPSTPPKNVMLVRVSGSRGKADVDRYSHMYYRTHQVESENDHVWIVPEGVNYTQDLLTRERVQTIQVQRMSEIANLPAWMDPREAVAAARQQGVDWLCVYSADSSYSGYGSNFFLALAQFVTMGLTPTTSDAKCRIVLLILDLRTNCVIDEWVAQETAWQPAVGLTLKEASQQSADRAETRALRAILDRIDDTLACTEPKSKRKSPTRTDSDWR